MSLEETRDGQTEDLEDALTEALERELDHLERVKSFGRASQYNRTIDNSPVTFQSDSSDQTICPSLVIIFSGTTIQNLKILILSKIE